MKSIIVEVREDHLESLAKTKPMSAMAELIWNALDAEATEVRVAFIENAMEGIDTICVSDNGHGLDYGDALCNFRNLGGSWKHKSSRTSRRKRLLHGKHGKGRFRAFSLGNHINWKTIYEKNGVSHAFSIAGKGEVLGEFTVDDPQPTDLEATGMRVEISNIHPCAELLRGVKAQQEVTALFAIYLRHYPDVRIHYDGASLDPSNAEEFYTNYELPELVMQNGERVAGTLTVVEWNLPGKRGVFLCDEHGFMLHNAMPRLHFRGFSYSAYLKSSHIAQLDREGLLETGDPLPRPPSITRRNPPLTPRTLCAARGPTWPRCHRLLEDPWLIPLRWVTNLGLRSHRTTYL